MQDDVQRQLDARDISEAFVDLSIPASIQEVADEISFRKLIEAARTITGRRDQRGFIGMHPGASCKQRDAKTPKDKEQARTMAAILLRLCCIFGLFLQRSAPCMLIIPWASNEDTIQDSDLFEEYRDKV